MSKFNISQEALKDFGEFSKDKLEFSSLSVSTDEDSPELSQTRELGPASVKLRNVLAEYHEFLDASNIISKLLDDFKKIHELPPGHAASSHGTDLKDQITEKVSYLDMLLSRLTSLERYQIL
ncbi:hypothetical protein DSO57_1036905 [Entomophthora muscae]|uniref:Uncharacterized protein n=1 Tax=Entomophthora muscae TaxID=34485 RepID=A0ACC2SZQ0_9FUNG|nr:hypothetical protein DSO57_1036905 [Entomophthora muscae]